MGSGLSGAALVEEDTAVVRGVKITPVFHISLFATLCVAFKVLCLPVGVLNASSRTTMQVDDGNAVWIAAFFPVDGVDIGHLEVTRLVYGEWGIKGCHVCVLKRCCLLEVGLMEG